MRPDIPPEPIQPHLRRRRPRPRHLKHAPRDPQRRLCRHHLDASHQLRKLAALARRQLVPVVPGDVVVVGRVQLRGRHPHAVRQRFGGGERGVEAAVALEDGELVKGRGFGVAAVGPGARGGAGVVGGLGEGALGDAEVEVGEDELDAVLSC